MYFRVEFNSLSSAVSLLDPSNTVKKVGLLDEPFYNPRQVISVLGTQMRNRIIHYFSGNGWFHPEEIITCPLCQVGLPIRPFIYPGSYLIRLGGGQT